MWIFSNKIKINLNEAAKLKKHLETWMTTNNKDIVEYNSIIKQGSKTDRPIDIRKILAQKNAISSLLCLLQEIIPAANLKKLKGDKYSNNYYIKKLSELDREEKFLKQLTPKQDIHQKGVTVRYDNFISKEEINKQLQQVLVDKSNIGNKLTKFNENCYINIPKNPFLYDIYRMVGIQI